MIATLGGAAVAGPMRAQAATPARLAFIAPANAHTEAPMIATIHAGLADNGLKDGRDYVLDVYFAEGEYSRFPALTQAALATNPAVLLVATIASVRAALQATRTVPIVFVAINDPVGAGLIDSLARPGGNATGVATMADDAVPKLVELVRTVLPQARTLAVLINPLNATNRPIFERVRTVGAGIGLEVRAIELSAPDGFDAAFGPRGEIAPDGVQPDALLLVADALFWQLVGRIAALGIERHIAVIGPSRNVAEAGALMSYGATFTTLVRRSMYYVKRILAGARPADLPVEQPTAFDLVINLRTAKALGLTLPQTLLASADDLIQ
ncbi:ABC transporter substrate-binding protein [Enhydrobacter aerosaccus]|uniref:ABC transporter substrate-binding protein n=1 Tax=Enhydrobacter aerosaccus TaxID=225324 RepID=UPI001482DECC|nr:ABC transporter substrate-binding protein [Enhydrobacter aerosaccus]